MTNQTTIQIGHHAIAIQCFASSPGRDAAVPAIAVMTDPVPVTAWPISPDQIAAAAAAKLSVSGGRADRRDDCLWALKAATVDLCDTHYWREARTDRQRAADHARGQSLSLRGDLS